MPFGIIPVLAQVFTVAVGDRAELRWVGGDQDSHYEGEDRATVSTSLVGRNSSVDLQYSPSIVVTPLESRPRTVTVFHHVGLGAAIGWQTSRRTTLTARQSAGYDRVNTRIQALSSSPTTTPGTAPTPGGQAPDPGGAADPPTGSPQVPGTSTDVRASQFTVETAYARSELALDHILSRRSRFGSFIAYGGSSGLGDSRALYPLTQGPDAGAVYGYRLGRNDGLSTTATARYAYTSRGDRAFIASLGEAWDHRFSRYAAMNIGIGLTYVYTDPYNAPPQEGLFLGAGAGGQLGFTYTYATKLYGGRLTLFVGASYAPVVDQSRFEPDLRFGVFSGATWVRRRLTLYANVGTILSANPDEIGSLNSVAGSLGSIYDIGAGFSFESGARVGWQTVGGDEILPPSVALFVALSWGAVLFRQ